MVSRDTLLSKFNNDRKGKVLKAGTFVRCMGRLLVVDDNEDTLETLKDILEGKGHQVVVAGNGEKALERFSEYKFDLALVDLKMEGISGFDVMRSIGDEHPDVIVVVLTGYASLDYAVQALRLGAYDFLEKPYEPEILLNVVERGLEKKQLKDFSEAIVEKMGEGLVLLDSQWSLDFTNDRFLEMLGYELDELQGKPLLSVVSPEDERRTIQYLRQIQERNPQRFQASLIRKDGTELMAIISFTNIGYHILSVITDITEIISPAITTQDLMYMTKPGHIYLVGEEKTRKAVEAFNDLIGAGFKGTVITREHPDEMRAKWKIDVPILRLTEEISGNSTLFPDVDLIWKKMEPHFSRNRVILIDRLDYLISTNSFEAVLKGIQKIRDLVLMKKSIVILSVDPRTLTKKEFSLLKKETYPLQAVSKPEIRGDLVELLTYIAKRNEVGAKPHHKQIGKKFNITRATVRQRLKLLHDKGLIVEKRMGRTKVVEITEKGRRTLV